MPCQHCGKLVYIAKARQKSFKYCSTSCNAKVNLSSPENQKKIKRKYGKENALWKDGFIEKRGYKVICVRGERVYEHRFLMEKKLGRKLLFNETIHHRNGIRSDNRYKNLELLSRSEHTKQNPRKKNPKKCIKCLNCNNVFYAKAPKNIFCSKGCWYKYPKKYDINLAKRQALVK